MKKTGVLIGMLCAALLLTAGVQRSWSLDAIDIAASVNENFVKEVNALDPAEHFDYHGLYRTQADIVILRKALYEGGLGSVSFTIRQDEVLARKIQMVKRGDVVLYSEDLPEGDFDNSVFMTRAVVPKRWFAKGIYTLPSNSALMKVTSLEELQQFSAVSRRDWWADWEMLEGLQLKKLFSTSKYANMLRMVSHGRVDFTVLDFSRHEDLSVKDPDGNTLVPVPGVKLVLNVSRHFMVSKAHPDGQRVFDALQKGLKILEERGEIERALTECGFYHETVKDWKILN